jgi:hypothetical protein
MKNGVAFDDPQHELGGDYLASADVHDVMALLDGRTSIADDVRRAADHVRQFVAERLDSMSERDVQYSLMNYLSGPTATVREQVIRTRVREITAAHADGISDGAGA